MDEVYVLDSPVSINSDGVLSGSGGLTYTELVNAILEVQGAHNETDTEIFQESDAVLSSVDDIQVGQSDDILLPQDVLLTQDVSSVLASQDLALSSPSISSSAPELEVGVTSPDPVLFNGAVWISGYDSELGDITLYFPDDTKDHWGVDSNGYLVYCGSGSVSGYLSSVYNNSVSCSSLSYPRYRHSASSSSYSYLSLIPENSNAPISLKDSPRLSLSDALPLLGVVLLGVIVLFTSKLLR